MMVPRAEVEHGSGAEGPRALGSVVPILRMALLLGWGAFSAVPAASQTVEGRILDAGSGEPVTGAVVELLDARGDAGLGVSSDAEGRFALRAPASGTYRIRAGRIGFQTVTTPTFDLVRDEDPFQVEVLLGAEAVPLAPLVIVSERAARLPHLRLHTRGFYERRRSWGEEGMGFGQFLGPEELEKRILFQASDALKDLRGVRVQGAGGRRQQVLLRGGLCPPPLYVDGVRVRGGNVDDIVAGPEILAIEVYLGITGPPEFVTSEGCGAIVVWTGARR